MANDFLNPIVITREALLTFNNGVVMLKAVDDQLSDDFAEKIGDQIRIRKAVRFLSANQADVTGLIQDIEEAYTTASITNRRSVPFQISGDSLTLTIQDFSKRYGKRATARLVADVETDIGKQYKKIYNFVGTPGAGPSTFLQAAEPADLLDELGVEASDRWGFFSPSSCTKIADSISDKFVNQKKTTKAIEQRKVGDIGGYSLHRSSSLAIHTVGNWGGTPLVNGGSQVSAYATVKNTWSQNLVTDGWTASTTGLLLEGDIITIEGVYTVNADTLESTGRLQTFVVNADVNSDGTGNATLNISPPIISSGPYQTVTIVPADNAAITVKTGAANSKHRQNLVWQRDAITVAFARMYMPQKSVWGAQEQEDSVNIRVIKEWLAKEDKEFCRYDILYAIEVQNVAFACRVTE